MENGSFVILESATNGHGSYGITSGYNCALHTYHSQEVEFALSLLFTKYYQKIMEIHLLL